MSLEIVFIRNPLLLAGLLGLSACQSGSPVSQATSIPKTAFSVELKGPDEKHHYLFRLVNTRFLIATF